jgi:hypothetical protein
VSRLITKTDKKEYNMQVIDDYTKNSITEFEFNDGSTARAMQNHTTSGAPFVVKGDITTLQKEAIYIWTGCKVI